MKRFSSIIAILLFTTFSTRAAGNADSINIEQIAFNYFISKLDSFSMDIYSNYRFNKAKDKIFYTGNTELFDDLVLGNFKSYTFIKKKFIKAGSFNERHDLLMCDKTGKRVISSDKFIVQTKNPAAKERKATDAFVSISNRYYHGEHYYVRIKIEQGLENFHSYFYVKLDSFGEPVNWVVAAEGEG